MFRTKLIVALILLPPFIWLWWTGGFAFGLLVMFFSAVAADEVMTMSSGGKRSLLSVSAMASALITLAPSVIVKTPWNTGEAIVIGVFLCFLAALAEPGEISQAANKVATTVFAFIYAAVPISFIVILRNQPTYGRGLTFVVLATAWMCDTFAYFGGRLLGRHKLYPLISPNKTIEGLLCGMAAAGISAAVASDYFVLPFSHLMAFALGFVGGFWGQVGDFAESLLKRSYGVKDSGAIMPGHGGLLDRCDALMFVGPLVYFAFKWLH